MATRMAVWQTAGNALAVVDRVDRSRKKLFHADGYDVVRIAGMSRARSPEWMEAHLPDGFRSLLSFGPRILQYKVCSTFDSAPHIGSIGKAIDIGTSIVGGSWSPIVAGAPQLGRW
jgi:uncharacterized protein YgbK (DUF1537 family)